MADDLGWRPWVVCLDGPVRIRSYGGAAPLTVRRSAVHAGPQRALKWTVVWTAWKGTLGPTFGFLEVKSRPAM